MLIGGLLMNLTLKGVFNNPYGKRALMCLDNGLIASELVHHGLDRGGLFV